MKASTLLFWLIGFSVLSLTSCSKGKTTLTLGIFAGNPWGVPVGDSYRNYDEAIRAFEAANPGIKVVYRSGTLREDYSEWLSQKIVQGTEPDVMVVLAEDFNTFSAIGVLQDLAPWMASDSSFNASSFYATALDSGRYQGRQFALPIETDPTLMFVNKTILKQAKVAMPGPNWTWNDFYGICKIVTRSDGSGALDRFGATLFSWQALAFSDGWRPFSASGSKAFFDDPSFVRTIAFVSDVRALSRGQPPPDFDSGEVAFSPDRFSNYRAYKYYPFSIQKFAPFNWEAIQMPNGPSGRNTSELPTLLMGISARSGRKAEAWKLLKLLSADTDTQLGVLRYSSGWPASKKAAEDPRVPTILRKNFPGTEGLIDVKVMNSILDKSISPPHFKRYEVVMDDADKELYRIIEDPFDLENRLHKLNREIDALLKN